jgi:DNA-binding NarL/FixJ family response regulator
MSSGPLIAVLTVQARRPSGLEVALQQQPGSPALYVDAWGGLESLLQDRDPDLLVVDHRLWQEASPRRLLALPTRGRRTRALVFADAIGPAIVAQAVAHEVDGCIAIDASPQQWLNAIRVVLRREIAMPRTVLADALRQSLRRRASDQGAQAGAPLRARNPRPDPGAELTGREREVVDIALAGLSNKAISRELGIGVATVKTHLHHAFAKLQIGRRMQLLGSTSKRRAVPLPDTTATPDS